MSWLLKVVSLICAQISFLIGFPRCWPLLYMFCCCCCSVMSGHVMCSWLAPRVEQSESQERTNLEESLELKLGKLSSKISFFLSDFYLIDLLKKTVSMVTGWGAQHRWRERWTLEDAAFVSVCWDVCESQLQGSRPLRRPVIETLKHDWKPLPS